MKSVIAIVVGFCFVSVSGIPEFRVRRADENETWQAQTLHRAAYDELVQQTTDILTTTQKASNDKEINNSTNILVETVTKIDVDIDKTVTTTETVVNTPTFSSKSEGIDSKIIGSTTDAVIANITTTTSCSSCTAENPSLLSKISNPCEVGECVPYYLCLNGSVITSGEGIIDVRFGADDDPEPERHPCPNFFDTCCFLQSETGIVKDTINPPPPIEMRDKCGIRNKNGTAFTLIERENEAQFAEFPWTVAIIYKVRENNYAVNVYKCGGSLIHPQVVMTASHCVIDLTNVQDISIRAGEWDTQTTDEPYPHQDRAVTEVIIHEHYRRGPHFNDVALLILETPVEIAENVNTACLPPQDFVFNGQRCLATGWGKDKFGKDGLYQVILKRVELPVIPSNECQRKLRETRLGRHFILNPSFICAGGEKGKDTCQGDGGSPLNCEIAGNEYGQYYLAGEVAWGIGCYDAIPGVYVNVAKYRQWVDNIFDKRNFDKKFYTAVSTF